MGKKASAPKRPASPKAQKADAAVPAVPRRGGIGGVVRVLVLIAAVGGVAVGYATGWDVLGIKEHLQAFADDEMYRMEMSGAEGGPWEGARRRTPAQVKMHEQQLAKLPDGPEKRVAQVMHKDMKDGEAWLAAHAAPQPRGDGRSCQARDGRVITEAYYYCDGVCDCCDGEDEADCPAVPGRAAPDCGKHCTRGRFARYWKLKEFSVEGMLEQLGTREAALKRSGLEWERFERHQAHIQKRLGDMQQKVQAKVKQMNGQVDAQTYQLYQQMMQESMMHRADLELTPEAVGPDLMLMPLMQQCASWAGNERYFKGGCAQPGAKEYNFTVCLFDKVMQQEVVPEGADRADPIFLGWFEGWQRRQISAVHNMDPEHRRVMTFTGGQGCDVGDKVIERTVAVELACGPKNALTKAFENGICQYEFEFQTPMVCTHTDLYKLQEEMVELAAAGAGEFTVSGNEAGD